MNITGIVVNASPGCAEAVRHALTGIGGVEVHAVTPEGRMVVTVERLDDRAAKDAFDAIGRVEGILSTALIYHHDEPLDEESSP